MLERRRQPRESQSLGGGIADLLSTGEGGLVTVSHGIHNESLPVANMTVSEIRTRFSDLFDIDPESTATLDGNEVTGETIVTGGQLLMFVRNAGVKGVA